MKKKEKRGKFDWPMVGLFLFAFVGMAASLSIIFTRGILVKTRVTLVNSFKIEEKDDRAFLWKDGEIPLAVIIDNMKDSWPPEGLEYARAVYEAPVEAGITRFLAIFGSDEEEDFEIGPVRSARPYLVDWAEEFGTVLAHVGGSEAALEQLKASKIFNLDEFKYGGKYFTRIRNRFAPHNTFISLQMLKKFWSKVSKDNEVNFNIWEIKDDAEDLGNTPAILIPYAEPYDARWEYRRGTNDYARFIGGRPFLTASDKQIRAKNVVVMKTDIMIIDSLSRRRIKTSGVGEALIFQDGKAMEGKWKNKDGYTKFYAKNGELVAFNRGPVWIEVVSDKTEIEY